MNGCKGPRELTLAETAIVSGGDFSWEGLGASMLGGVVVGAWIGATAFGFAYLGPGAIAGGFAGGLVGGADYVFGELVD
jgi:hypothetical protein